MQGVAGTRGLGNLQPSAQVRKAPTKKRARVLAWSSLEQKMRSYGKFCGRRRYHVCAGDRGDQQESVVGRQGRGHGVIFSLLNASMLCGHRRSNASPLAVSPSFFSPVYAPHLLIFRVNAARPFCVVIRACLCRCPVSPITRLLLQVWPALCERGKMHHIPGPFFGERFGGEAGGTWRKAGSQCGAES